MSLDLFTVIIIIDGEVYKTRIASLDVPQWPHVSTAARSHPLDPLTPECPDWDRNSSSKQSDVFKGYVLAGKMREEKKKTPTQSQWVLQFFSASSSLQIEIPLLMHFFLTLPFYQISVSLKTSVNIIVSDCCIIWMFSYLSVTDSWTWVVSGISYVTKQAVRSIFIHRVLSFQMSMTCFS